MFVKLWGVRGSIPAPMSDSDYKDDVLQVLSHAKQQWEKNLSLKEEEVFNSLPEDLKRPVGGDTTCVEVRYSDFILILDMGSGARRLGMNLMARKYKGEYNILITHTHWDHIQGWPFFVPGYIPGNTVNFYSSAEDLEERLEIQQQFKFFPLAFSQMASKKNFKTIVHGQEFQIGPFTINTLPLFHPGGSTAYKIQAGGKTMVFATDTEFYGENLDEEIAKSALFFKNADLLLMDAQYTYEEAGTKIGWGHTSVPVAIRCALEWNVKELILTHHEPAYSNRKIYDLHEAQIDSMRGEIEKHHIKIKTAVEGMEFNLADS